MSGIKMTLDKNKSRTLQRALREITGIPLGLDGKLGESSLKALQKCSEILGITPVPTAFEGTAFVLVMRYVEQRFVSEEAFEQAAKLLGVDTASVRAIAEVESRQSGFMPDGKLTILFERHWFYRKLKEALKGAAVRDHVAKTLGVSLPDLKDKTGSALLDLVSQRYPEICNAAPGGYNKDGNKEWDRLRVAITLDAESAFASASYGSFQIMGFNHGVCGYKLPSEMVVDFARSESAQFIALCLFIKENPKIHKALKAKDWAGFASGYNGPDYRKNKYDEKLANAYKKWLLELKNN